MSHRCYDCGKTMNHDDIVAGAAELVNVMQVNPDFEGWVHCMGDNDQFLDEERDAELIAELNEKFPAGADWVGIVVCAECVQRVSAEELETE